MSNATEVFVAKVRAKIGNSYDLSKVVYEHAHRRVHVVCPKHGDKYPVAYDLSIGRVCRECSTEKRKRTMVSLKQDAAVLYGDKYNYDHLVVIKNNREKFTLVCSERGHGSFQINMLKHLQGHACPKCGVARRAKARTLLQEAAIKTLQDTAIGDYDFSEFVYTGGPKKGVVVCRKHQHRFAMTYANLTRGHGCPKCGHERNVAAAPARGVAGMRSLVGAKWTVATPDGVVKAGSSWEVLVYRWLRTRYSDVKTQLYIKTHLGGYMPDFYIPEKDLYVEVKGREITKGQEAKRDTLSNVLVIRSADMIDIFGKRWYMPKTWGNGLSQVDRNGKLNTADLGQLPDVETWLEEKMALDSLNP